MRPGDGQIPAPATIFKLFHARFSNSSSVRVLNALSVRNPWRVKRPSWASSSGNQLPATTTIFENCRKMTSKRNERKIHLPPRGLPNRLRPGGGQIPAPATILEHFLSRFGSSSSDDIVFTRVACEPHSPRPKDCPGLGDPNTLKQTHVFFTKKSKKRR